MINYEEAIAWIYEKAANYQKIGNEAYKPGFKNILNLMDYYDHPYKLFKSIHIGGTNGKGSVAHMVSSILQENGYKVGLFSSPHLINLTERIKINGLECSQDFILKNIINIKKTKLKFSFFELLTAFAFKYFALNQVDFAIIEVGLGGRLDATNIILPEISAITSIDFDHQDLLGSSLLEIAYEKSGIIKFNRPIVIGENKKHVIDFLNKKAKKKHSKLILPNFLFIKSDLKGEYQIQNQNTSLGIIKELKNLGYKISKKSINNGLKNVIKNTKLRGRWEIISNKPLIIFDAAHNIAGIKKVFKQLLKFNKPIVALMGFVQEKNVKEIINILPIYDIYYIFTKPDIIRGLDPNKYISILEKKKLNYIIIDSLIKSFDKAIKILNLNTILIVTGSIFIVGDLLKKIDKNANFNIKKL